MRLASPLFRRTFSFLTFFIEPFYQPLAEERLRYAKPRVKRILRFLVLFYQLSFLASCAPIISKELRAQVDKEIHFGELSQDPTSYLGKIVLLGGEIIGAKNTKDGTLIEILQRPTNSEGRPKNVDLSEGRFLAHYDGYLDSAIYAKGREVTVAGAVKGERVLPMDEIEYVYPVVEIKEIHLWPSRTKQEYYSPPYHYYPWWWYYPYPGPAIIIRGERDG